MHSAASGPQWKIRFSRTRIIAWKFRLYATIAGKADEKVTVGERKVKITFHLASMFHRAVKTIGFIDHATRFRATRKIDLKCEYE